MTALLTTLTHRLAHGRWMPRVYRCAACRADIASFALSELARDGRRAVGRTCRAASIAGPAEAPELHRAFSAAIVDIACELTFPYADQPMRETAGQTLREHIARLHAARQQLSERDLVGFAQDALFEQACAPAQAA